MMCPQERQKLFDLVPEIYGYKEKPEDGTLDAQITKYEMGWQITFDRVRTLLGLKISKKYLPQLVCLFVSS